MKKVLIGLFILIFAFMLGFFVRQFVHLYQVDKQLDEIKKQSEQLDAEVKRIYEQYDLHNELDVEEGALVYEFGTD